MYFIRILALLIGIGHFPAFAAEFVSVEKKGNVRYVEIYISGVINEGDDRKLHDLVVEYHSKTISLFVLNFRSPGGDLDAGIRLGRIARKIRAVTAGPIAVRHRGELLLVCDSPNSTESSHNTIGDAAAVFPGADDDNTCICASACALAWAGGIKRRGLVGFHRPYLIQHEGLELGDIEKGMRQSAFAVREYLREVDVQESIINNSETMNSEEIYFPNENEEKELEYTPALEELIISYCSFYSNLDESLSERQIALSMKDADGTISKSERSEMEYILDISQKRNDCEQKVLIDAVGTAVTYYLK